MISVNDLRQGTLFLTDANIYQVLEFRRHKMARARAVVNVKARDIKSNGVREFTFLSNDMVEEAELANKTFKFVYRDERKKQIILTDPNSNQRHMVDEMAISENQLGFLKDGIEVSALTQEDDNGKYTLYSVSLPNTVDLKVTQAPPSERGDTAAGSTKPVEVETGITIKTPFFIKTGDVIRVNTGTGEYVERVVS